MLLLHIGLVAFVCSGLAGDKELMGVFADVLDDEDTEVEEVGIAGEGRAAGAVGEVRAPV